MTLVQVVNKLVPLADITKLVGQEGLSQAPRVGLALGPVTEWGMVSHLCNRVLSEASVHRIQDSTLHKSAMHVSVSEVTSVLCAKAACCCCGHQAGLWSRCFLHKSLQFEASPYTSTSVCFEWQQAVQHTDILAGHNPAVWLIQTCYATDIKISWA